MAPIDTQDTGNAGASALKSKLTLNKSATRVVRPDAVADTPQSAPEMVPMPATHGIRLMSPLTIGIFALVVLLGGAMVFLPSSKDDQITRAAATKPETIVSPEINVVDSLSEIAPVSAPITVAIPTLDVVSSEELGETDELVQRITRGTLDALRNPNTRTSGPKTAALPAPEPANTLQKLIQRALDQGQSAGYIDVLLNDALARGQIKVPAALIKADGKVDTPSILAMFAQ